jgi:hypothetical protein
VTSEESEEKELQRKKRKNIWDIIRGRDGSSQSQGTPRLPPNQDDGSVDYYKWNPKRDRDK